jgi:hypothetical protein
MLNRSIVAGILAVMAPTIAPAADVDLSLNLRYTCPSQPAEGGRWFLLAKTDDSDGLAAISAYLTNINTAGMVYGNGGVPVGRYSNPVTATNLGAASGMGPFHADLGGGVTNIIYTQILEAGFIVPGVGSGSGTPGNLAVDPLANSTWNNAALIASGTFPGGGDASNQFNRPAFVIAGGNQTSANTLDGFAAELATSTTTVRGDSLHTLNLESPDGSEGLRWGDVNRDFRINIGSDVLVSLANIGLPNTGWDQGNFDCQGTVNISKDILPALAGIGMPGLPVSASPVPEASAMALAGIGLVGMGGMVAARNRIAGRRRGRLLAGGECRVSVVPNFY